MKTSSLLGAAVALISLSSSSASWISSIVSGIKGSASDIQPSSAASPEPEPNFFGEPCIDSMDLFCPSGYNADAVLPPEVADQLKSYGVAPASLLSEDVITCGIVGLLGLFTKADGHFCPKLLAAAGYCCALFESTHEPSHDWIEPSTEDVRERNLRGSDYLV